MTTKVQDYFEIVDGCEKIEALEKLIGKEINKEEPDLILEIEGVYVPYIPATRWQPEEGGYAEDIHAYFEGKDVTDIFSDREEEWQDLIKEEVAYTEDLRNGY